MDKNILYICILSFFLFGCTNSKEKNYDISQSKKNKYFSSQAELFFGGILQDKMSFSSYSADDVSYSININDFNYSYFIKAKMVVLKNNGWVFLKKYKQSYIFCNGKDQLEIIIPRKIAQNKTLVKGSIGMQLEDNWNILFSHPKNSTWFECSNSV
ncbi:MAG: hypothetical protein RR479_06305 [Acinetobacter sp.]